MRMGMAWQMSELQHLIGSRGILALPHCTRDRCLLVCSDEPGSDLRLNRVVSFTGDGMKLADLQW